MTVRYDCDGPDCDRRMTRNEPRLAITVEDGDPPPPEPIVYDPDDDDMLPEVDVILETKLDMFMDGDFHFCGETCLTSWAMSRALDNERTDDA